MPQDRDAERERDTMTGKGFQLSDSSKQHQCVLACFGLKKKMREEENEPALYHTVRVPQAHHSVLHRVAHTGVTRRM